MKFVFALIATLFVAVNAIDLDNLEPLDVFPRIPIHPDLNEKNEHGRIVGGMEAKPNEFPYQVGLAISMGGKTGWCGGSIISEQYVITAAHCTENAESVEVYLGAHNIKEQEPNAIRIKVDKENIKVHEKWSMTTLSNDISLIKLPEPIEFNEYIQPINLPKRSQVDESFVDKMVTASGWGKDSDKATTVSPVLRFVEVPVLAHWRCNIRFLGMIRDSHICIKGAGGKSTCNGDSGGPLAYTEEDGTKTLLGCTSFGISFGCEWGWPGVFTRFTSFLDWIEDNSDVKIRA